MTDSMLTAAKKSDLHLTDQPPVQIGRITQSVLAVAFGSPSAARRLGSTAVEEHEEDLRQLADS